MKVDLHNASMNRAPSSICNVYFNVLRLLTQVRKMLQLKEALDQRMGCVIVGPSGCGKSTLWSILRHAMIKCGQAVNTHVVNPKSMPRQVRGHFTSYAECLHTNVLRRDLHYLDVFLIYQ